MITGRARGTADILPGESAIWQFVEQTARELFALYNYHEIRTPIFEHTELFLRGVGETTDIVSKEMYTFTDRGDRSLTLRPEGTAGAVRAFVENKLYGQPLQPTKLYYAGPMFRYERPQAGRMRQLHQCGVEVLGSDHPSIDAEVIALGSTLLQRYGLNAFRVELGSVGCSECRATHRDALVHTLEDVRDQLCEDCQSRFERNPLRILDCKNDSCKTLTAEAPTMLDYLCSACSQHFSDVQAYLQSMDIAFTINPRLVRGLDYYTRTAFEMIEEGIGANSTVLAGGRYNGLVATLGGPETPGIGFAFGMERVILAMASQQTSSVAIHAKVDAFVASVGESADREAARLLQELRQAGVSADKDYTGRGFKAQMRHADRLAARYSLVIGDEELTRGVVGVRDMTTGEQVEVSRDSVCDHMIEAVRKGES